MLTQYEMEAKERLDQLTRPKNVFIPGQCRKEHKSLLLVRK